MTADLDTSPEFMALSPFVRVSVSCEMTEARLPYHFIMQGAC